jgi:hypothetical protein
MPTAFATRKLLRLLDEQFDFKKSGCRKARQFFLRFYAKGAKCHIHFDTAKFFKREITPRSFTYKFLHGIGFFKSNSTSKVSLLLKVNTPLGGSLLTSQVAAGATTVPGSRGKARFYHEVPEARCYELTAGIDWKEHNGPKLQSVRDQQATEGDTQNLRVPPSLLKDLAKGITHSDDNPFTRSQCALGGSRKTPKKTAARQKSGAGCPSKAVRRSGGQLPDQKFPSINEAALWLVEQTGKTTNKRVGIAKCVSPDPKYNKLNSAYGYRWCLA